MKKFISLILSLSAITLAGCASEKPLTEKEQAAKYGLTVERYREEKTAAARMNMNFEEHIKMIQEGEMKGGMKMDDMNMQ